MDRIIVCIARDHDWRVTLLAALICMVGIGVSTHVMERVRPRDPAGSRRAVAMATIVGALSIWSTHFVAMQGFVAGVPVRYDLMLTLASLIVALAMIGLTIASTQLGKGRAWRVMAAVIAVTGVGSMHYLGMAAIQGPAQISWDPALVAASLVAAMIVGGTTSFFYRRGGPANLLMTTIGLSMTVLVLHFLGMAAMTVVPDPTVLHDDGLSPAAMRVLVGVVLLLVCGVGGALAAMIYTRRSSDLRRIREAVDAMPDGLGFYDSKDRLVLWNARYAELNPELQPHLVVGLAFRDALRIGIDQGRYDEALGREDEWLTERIQARSQLSSNIEQQVGGGRWLRVQDRRTSEGGTVVVCNDITDLKRDAEALAEAKDAAEAANVAKSQFLANMSHEIRTPLNGVIGLSQALAKTELTADQREMLDLMQASGQDVANPAQRYPGPGPRRIGQAGADRGRIRAGGRGARGGAALCRERPPEAVWISMSTSTWRTGVWVMGDAVRVKQVLTNLISNAVKFTSQGFVGLVVQQGQDRDGRPVLRFTVEDSGIGFDAATRESACSPDSSKPTAASRASSAARAWACRSAARLADMMGGDLDCESEPGSGAAFILTLPLKPCAAPKTQEPADTAAQHADGARAVRVLVADDHPTNRRVIELILAQTSAKIVMAENGAEALEAFRADVFDLVLMDMQMPVMDGLTATQEIRLHEAAMGLARTPIVMLTANAMPEHVAAGRAGGRRPSPGQALQCGRTAQPGGRAGRSRQGSSAGGLGAPFTVAPTVRCV